MLIQFPYNAEAIDAIKELPSRKWNKAERGWEIPDFLASAAAVKLEPFYPDIAEALRGHVSSITVEARRDISDAQSGEDVTDRNAQRILDRVQRNLDLPLKLFPYQEVGVTFIELSKGKALIGDDMGLGKTAQSLAWLAMHKEKRPVIVICPASVKVNWGREIDKWIPDTPFQIINSGKDEIEEDKEVYIINYDLLRKHEESLIEVGASVVILDEATYIKERKSQRTKVTMRIAKNSPHILALSGTPILNKPIEFFNVLNLLAPTVFKSQWQFGHQFCGMENNGYGFSYSGATNTELLNFLLKSIMIRREKKEVLKDLPPKRRVFKYIGIPTKIIRMHEVAERELTNAVKDYRIRGLSSEERSERRMLAITALGYLRQVVGMAKAEQTLEIVRPTLEKGEKIVIFGHHKAVLDKLEEDITKAGYGNVRIDGQVTGKKRQNLIDEFQNNPDCKVMVASILAMGMGVNLVSASSVFIVERQWTPAYEEQGEDRLWRIGQEKEVTAWYLVTADTVDDKMNQLIEHKRAMVHKILDGKSQTEESLVSELLETY